VRVRNKDHYRVFFSDKTGLCFGFSKKQVEVLPFNLGKVPTCIGSFEMTTGERVFMGCGRRLRVRA
jgi:hypothetical protein